ncbi:MAG TPA: hypothetical protein VIJ78_13795, partial [Pseudolabrys sp.]
FRNFSKTVEHGCPVIAGETAAIRSVRIDGWCGLGNVTEFRQIGFDLFSQFRVGVQRRLDELRVDAV